MFRNLVNLFVILPLAVVFIIFAVANRHIVTVSFDPFNTADTLLTLPLPLFIVILLSAIAGVIAGGTVVWFRQRHWRRTVRRYEAEARQAKQDEYRRTANDTPMYPGALIGPPI